MSAGFPEQEYKGYKTDPSLRVLGKRLSVCLHLGELLPPLSAWNIAAASRVVKDAVMMMKSNFRLIWGDTFPGMCPVCSRGEDLGLVTSVGLRGGGVQVPRGHQAQTPALSTWIMPASRFPLLAECVPCCSFPPTFESVSQHSIGGMQAWVRLN